MTSNKTKEIKMKLVLGSSSIFRRKVMIGILKGIEDVNLIDIDDPKYVGLIEWLSPDIDEKAIRDKDPAVLTMKISHAKADALLKEHKFDEETLVITSDQVTVFEGEIREKPIDKEEGIRFFYSYTEDKPATVVNAIVITNTRTGRRVEGNDTAKQYWKGVPNHIFDEVLEKGDILKCCGCFMIEEPLLQPYLGKRVGEASSIMGLPETLLRNLLKECGLSI